MYRRRRSELIFVQTVGSQYYQSAVGLVFMESAVELAMETSRVDSVVSEELKCEANQLDHVIVKLAGESKKKKKIRVISTADESVSSRKDISTSLFKKKKKRRWSWNEEVQQEATVGYQQKRRGARYVMSCDDISLDVITISSWLSADEAKRERRSDVVLRFSRWISVDDVIGDKLQRPVATQRHPVAMCLSIQTQEDSGEAFDVSDASNSSIQSKSLFESAVANQPVTSFAIFSRLGSQAQRIEEGAKRSSRCVKSVAKQSKIKAGCQLLRSIQMKKATGACKRKGRKYCSSGGTLQRSVAQK
ncbi:hypothetical protein F511_14924 [Dorcoceras hygrometricum]|uniref:Uncharacterized protein n=1 Tax=Dorcoceras hygrometricum TaxID=472368 RepID=A0A2Z7AIF8_9LAMI|nr:hypothetical protein F511_14924 [Dorcoceras hygrometricum]